MEIHFEVGGRPALFQRNSWTGRADLSVGDQTFLLQSPWRLGLITDCQRSAHGIKKLANI